MKKIKEIFKKFFKWIENVVEYIFNSENILLIIAIIIGIPICIIIGFAIFAFYLVLSYLLVLNQQHIVA